MKQRDIGRDSMSYTFTFASVLLGKDGISAYCDSHVVIEFSHP